MTKPPSYPEKPGLRTRCFVILCRPENPENVGSVARAMKNTGFGHLRIVGQERMGAAFRTAVHAGDILDGASFYLDLRAAEADLNVIFAATSKPRKNFSILSLEEAVERMFSFPPLTGIGLVFGNERTGLTSAELRSSNYRFMIPQAGRQPSYNLAAAALLTLFHIFRHGTERLSEGVDSQDLPLPQAQQEECIHFIINKLEGNGFIHATNRAHMTERIFDLLGRLALTARDRKLLLAIFSHVGDGS